MALLDIAIIGLILISVLVGFIRGFTKELMSIAAWVISIYLAFKFNYLGASYFEEYINNEVGRNIASGAVIFVVSLFLLSFLGYVISKIASKKGIKGTDRVLGLVLGFFRGILIISFLIVVTSIFNVQNTAIWKSSSLVEYFQPVASKINSVLPESLKVSNITGAVDAAAAIQSIVPSNESDNGVKESAESVQPEESKPSN